MTRHDLLPIYVRVTIKGERFEVATNLHAKPTEWAAAGGKILGRSASALQSNIALDTIRIKLYSYRDLILTEGRELTVCALHEKWFGEDRQKRTLMGVIRLSILDLQKLVAKGIYKKSTITKYLTTEAHLIKYLQWSGKGADILLFDLRIGFIENFQLVGYSGRDPVFDVLCEFAKFDHNLY